jgi:hypothetical protein
MKKSENNDQYLTKTVISARSQEVIDLRILPLCVHSCVGVLDHTKTKKKVAGQIRIRRSRRRESYLRKLWNVFPGRYLRGKQMFSP